MKEEVTIIIADDDEGHVALIKKNLKRVGVSNKILDFKDGKEVLEFFFNDESTPHWESDKAYLLLLDIRMPRVDGVEVLRKMKENKELKKVPVIMLTTTDDPREIENCHNIGCSNYITKPVDYEVFMKTIQQVGLFLSVVDIPQIRKH